MIRRIALLMMVLGFLTSGCSASNGKDQHIDTRSTPVQQSETPLQNNVPTVPITVPPPPPVPPIPESEALTVVDSYWKTRQTAFDKKDATPLGDIEDFQILAHDQTRINRLAKYEKNPSLFYTPDNVDNVKIFTTHETPAGADRYFLADIRITIKGKSTTAYQVFRQTSGDDAWKLVFFTWMGSSVIPDPFPTQGTTLDTLPGRNAVCDRHLNYVTMKDTSPDPWGKNVIAHQDKRVKKTSSPGSQYIEKIGGHVTIKTESAVDDTGPTWVLPTGTHFAPCSTLETWTFAPPSGKCFHWNPSYGDEMIYQQDLWGALGIIHEATHYGLTIPPTGPTDAAGIFGYELAIQNDTCPESQRHWEENGP